MIEIILRDDVSKYETKPLFGFSYRQVLAFVCAVAIGYVIWVGLSALKVPYELIGLVIIAAAALVGACFMAKIQGMYGSKRLPILLDYRKRSKTVFAQNAVYKGKNKQKKMYVPETGEVLKNTKKNMKQYRKAAKQAKKETEFYDYENNQCVSAKQRLCVINNKD